MKHISVKYRHLQDAITNQEVWLRKVGTKHNVADGLTKKVDQVSISLSEQKTTPAALGVSPSTGHMNIVTDC